MTNAMGVMSDWWTNYQAENEKMQQTRKERIKAEMEARGIVRVTGEAYGSGDSGDINDITFFDAEGEPVDVDWGYGVGDTLGNDVADFFVNAPGVDFNNDGCEAELEIDLGKPEGQQFAVTVSWYETVSNRQPPYYA